MLYTEKYIQKDYFWPGNICKQKMNNNLQNWENDAKLLQALNYVYQISLPGAEEMLTGPRPLPNLKEPQNRDNWLNPE